MLGVREEPGRPLVQTLCAALASRRTLLIFDNCEHLIVASADLADAILRAAPQVHVMASSREALRVPGEQVYPVLPLPLPDRDDGLDALSRSTAVRLFVERARSHKPSFVLNAREAPAVAELVVRLEGIPLAIELAAARVRSLSVADINVRLKDRYKLLTGGGRVLLARQQTLRALVDWSYELLNDDEQRVFSRLAVFAAGFDLDAAEQVCGADPLSPDDVLDLLSSLVDKSLVSMDDERDDGTRYRMLETIRDYAVEKLQQSADAAATAARHCDHYFALAKKIRDGLEGAGQSGWIRRGETELDNLRAATALALAGGTDPIIAVKLAVTMTPVLDAARLPVGRASHRARRAGAARGTGLGPGAGPCGLRRRGAGHRPGRSCRSPADAGEVPGPVPAAGQPDRGGRDAVDAGAWPACRRAMPWVQRPVSAKRWRCSATLGEKEGEVVGLLHLGQIAVYVGNNELAQSSLSECLLIARPSRIASPRARPNCGWARTPSRRADPDDARRHLERSLAVCREAGDRRGEAHAQYWLGKIRSGGRRYSTKPAGDSARPCWPFVISRCVKNSSTVSKTMRSWRSAWAVQNAARSPCRRGRAVPRAAGHRTRRQGPQRRWQARLAALRSASRSRCSNSVGCRPSRTERAVDALACATPWPTAEAADANRDRAGSGLAPAHHAQGRQGCTHQRQRSRLGTRSHGSRRYIGFAILPLV